VQFPVYQGKTAIFRVRSGNLRSDNSEWAADSRDKRKKAANRRQLSIAAVWDIPTTLRRSCKRGASDITRSTW